MTEALDEIVVEFVVESREGLDGVEEDLLVLESSPDDKARLDAVFRAVHSIKGTAGLLGYGKMEAIAHAGETLMSRVREGELPFTADAITVLLQTLDALRHHLDEVEATGADGETDDKALIEDLMTLSRGETVSPQAPPVVEEAASELPPGNDELEWLGPPPGWNGGKAAAEPEPEPEPVAAEPVAAEEPVAESKPAKEGRRERLADAHVRVDVRVLDQLMNLVGELVLVRNRMMQDSGLVQDSRLSQSTQQLDLITTELQEGVMKTRMQTVGTVLSRIPRQVRDLCRSFGKDIKVEITGQETELDRTVIEAIKDPLTHLVRNAVDHGIETPDERRRSRKRPQGTLKLEAFHEGGQVNIAIKDDGAGIRVDKVCQRALERGIVTQAQLARMSDRDLLELIFRPGFSTAAKVTNVSGRGVGMDVVRTHIEQIGGTVEVQSEPGKGTTFLLRIPLTLAIIPTLLVTCGGSRYAVPQVSLVELVRIDAEQAATQMRTLHGARVLRLRGKLLPIVDLSNILGTASTREPGDAFPVVVLQAGRMRFGLVVDEINDTEEIVVKPLGRLLKGLSPYAGATILGDGSVALILDVPELARTAELKERKEAPVRESAAAKRKAGGTRMQLLTFALGDGRMAVPLEQVARLEEVEATRVESAAGLPVLQYRDDLLPLIFLGEALGSGMRPESELFTVLVCRLEEGNVGVVVDRILDIVEEEVRLLKGNPMAPAALSRTAVIEGKVTDLLDVSALVQSSAVPLLASA